MVDRTLPGADPIISPAMAGQFVESEIRSEISGLKMQAFAYGVMIGEQRDRMRSIESGVEDIIEALTTGGVPGGPPGSSPFAPAGGGRGGGGRGGSSPFSPSGPPSGSGPGGPPPPLTPSYRKGDVVDESGETMQPQQGENLRPMSFSEGRRIAQSRTSAAEWGSRFIEQRTPRFTRNEAGEYVTEQYVFDEASGPEEAYLQRDPRTGEVLNAIRAGDGALDEVAATDQGSARMRMVSSALARYGAGEGIMGALGGGVKAGVAGAVVTGAFAAANKVGDFFAGQQAAAAPYKQVYGADAGRYALGQRFDRRLAGLEGFFSGVGSERAQAGFDVATSLGFTGERFDAATQFDEDLYKRYGMSADQTGRFLQLNAQDARYSLEDLANQIDRVSAAAVDAGKNSQQYVDVLASVGQRLRGFSADSSTQETATQITTTALTNLPANLSTEENIQAIAGTLTDQNVLLNATMAGANPWEAITETYTSPDAQQASVEMTLDLVVRQVALNAGETPESLRAKLDEMFGGRKPEKKDYVAITRRWNAINHLTIRQIAAAMNYEMTEGQEMDLFLEGLYGAFEGLHTPGAPSAAEFTRGIFGGDPEAPEIIKGGWEGLQGGEEVNEAVGGNNMFGLQGSAGDVYNEYQRYGRETGNRNTAVERLLSKSQYLEEETGQDFGDITYNTSKGEKTLSEIIGDKGLRSELVEGGVTSANAKGGEDIDVSSLLGVGDTSDNPSTVFDQGQGSPGWLLDLTPRAMELLELRGPSDSQRAGVPPLGTFNPLTMRR